MATTAILPIRAGKRVIAAALKMSLDYIKNPEKTDDGEWVTSYECDPLIVDSEFAFSKRQYAAITGRDQGAHDVIAYHVRISFKPGETDAATANRIGYELAMKLSGMFRLSRVHSRKYLIDWMNREPYTARVVRTVREGA